MPPATAELRTTFDAQTGLKAEFNLFGCVSTEFGAFYKKSVSVGVSSPPDRDWLVEVLGPADAAKACGLS